MNPVNFCYWLQGARELCGLESPTIAQVENIRKHLALVPMASMRSSNMLLTLIEALRGSLIFGEPNWDLVWRDLDNVFEHVIDKMAAGDQSMLNEVHGSTPRC